MLPNFLPKAYFREDFVDFEKANISIATHALHYGTGAFGGMRGVINTEDPSEVILFRLKDHSKRLSNSAKFLLYDLDENFISQKITEFVKINKSQKNFYIRSLVYASGLGISPRLHNLEKDFLIYGIEMGDYLNKDGVKVCFSSWQRISDTAVPSRGKITGTYINSALAKTEAIERGFDEALMLDNQGNLSEASAMNVFMVRNGTLYTPPVSQDLLEGITRRSIIKIAKDMSLDIVERNISKTELIIADEVFLTGTAAKITPIKQIEFYKLSKEKPITEKLKTKLNEISLGKDKKYENWLTRINI